MVRSWRLGLLALGIIPITAVINFYYGRFLHHNQVKVQNALADANHVANEVVGAIRTVFSFATEPMEHGRYKMQIDGYYGLNVRQIFVTAIYFGVCNTFLINTVVQAALLGYGAFLAKDPTIALEPKVLLAVMLYQGQLGEYFRNLLTCFNSLIKSSGAAAKVFDYIDRKPRYTGGQPRFTLNSGSTRQHSSDARGVREVGATHTVTGNGGNGWDDDSGQGGHIVFDKVHFCYPTRPESEVLKGVSFTAAPGEVVALVGPSGSSFLVLLGGLMQRVDVYQFQRCFPRR
jgi:ATP-binding cassette, subfamily B (MDR/TAP), member 9